MNKIIFSIFLAFLTINRAQAQGHGSNVPRNPKLSANYSEVPSDQDAMKKKFTLIDDKYVLSGEPGSLQQIKTKDGKPVLEIDFSKVFDEAMFKAKNPKLAPATWGTDEEIKFKVVFKVQDSPSSKTHYVDDFSKIKGKAVPVLIYNRIWDPEDKHSNSALEGNTSVVVREGDKWLHATWAQNLDKVPEATNTEKRIWQELIQTRVK